MRVIKKLSPLFLIVLQVHLQLINTEATFLLPKGATSLLSRSKLTSTSTTTMTPEIAETSQKEQEEPGISLDQLAEETDKLTSENSAGETKTTSSNSTSNEQFSPLDWAYDKRLFAMELLRMLHEKYGSLKEVVGDKGETDFSNKEDRHQPPLSNRPMMIKLLEAIKADGDMQRLVDWVQNSFNLASVGELTTQFVVSKLGSVNCAALFQPDTRESLVPRFLLFNEHFTDVPYELSLTPTSDECLAQGRFDPLRKTVVLIHGYLTGYTLVDGLTNIKNRLLDLNKIVNERALATFTEAAQSNGSYLLTGDLEAKLRRQKYNVIIVDWFSGANPVPRANYIQAAANARAVGEHIAQFLINLTNQCRTPSTNLQIIAHSLGCHVAGFTGKSMNAAGRSLGKITHLDPIGLCFGRLFSNPLLRLNPNDAIDTQAVHVSLNLFDNPLDGAKSNFLVNGGRDQAGCQGTSELKNSTTSSVSLLVDPRARFSPCSHLRALALFEDDLSSSSQTCQIVGYRCATYERFLAGKCGKCDATNSQCRLMSLPPLMQQFSRINLDSPINHHVATKNGKQLVQWDSETTTFDEYPRLTAIKYNNNNNNNNNNSLYQMQQQQQTNTNQNEQATNRLLGLVRNHSNGSIAWVIDDDELNARIGQVIAKMKPNLVTNSATTQSQTGTGESLSDNKQLGDLSTKLSANQVRTSKNPRYTIVGGNDLNRRSDRRLIGEHRDLIAQTLDKIKTETRNALSGGWTSIMHLPNVGEPKYKVSSLFNLATNPTMSLFSGLVVPKPSIELDSISIPVNSGGLSEALQSQAGAFSLEHQEIAPVEAPIGSQPLPAGSSIGPLYFVGTSALSPYCVNYYQFRMLIAESRIRKHLQSGQVGNSRHPNQINRMAHISSHGTNQQHSVKHANQESGKQMLQQQQQQQQDQQQQSKPRQATLHRDMLHFSIKLSDSFGHFFKGFTIIEDTRLLPRAPASDLMGTRGPTSNENMVELTLLLNSTNSQPVKISETIVSYYFHGIVLADTVEVNYMSNISPEIRAKYSSVLCPIAINDQHQLVKYIECNKIGSR